jgi:hypothetical protein
LLLLLLLSIPAFVCSPDAAQRVHSRLCAVVLTCITAPAAAPAAAAAALHAFVCSPDAAPRVHLQLYAVVLTGIAAAAATGTRVGCVQCC